MPYQNENSSVSSCTSTTVITQLPSPKSRRLPPPQSMSSQPLNPPTTKTFLTCVKSKASKSTPRPKPILSSNSNKIDSTSIQNHRKPSSPIRLNRFPTRFPATTVKVSEFRTRSSRLFIVLLHLVGVSTNVPSSPSSPTYAAAPSTSASSSPLHSLTAFIQSLVHLLREHRPAFLTWSVGIVGVHPTAILLERLKVESSQNGLRGVLERVERVWGWNGDKDLLGEPYWFQDNTDGKCLGPGGFSECGDATLWRIRRRPLSKKKLLQKRQKQQQWRRRQRQKDQLMQHLRESEGGESHKDNLKQRYQKKIKSGAAASVCVWPFFCEEGSQVLQREKEYDDDMLDYGDEGEEEEEGFALQLMDLDAVVARSPSSSYFDGIGLKKRGLFWSFHFGRGDTIDAHSECLLSFASNDNVYDKSTSSSQLRLGPCSSEEAWAWNINRDGVLERGLTKSEKRKKLRQWTKSSCGVGCTMSSIRRGDSATRNSPAVDSEGSSCIHRDSNSTAILMPCSVPENKKISLEHHFESVGFSLVRYPSPTTASSKTRRATDLTDSKSSWSPWTNLSEDSTPTLENDTALSQNSSMRSEGRGTNASVSENHLFTSRTSSQSHASGAKQRPMDVKSTERMLHTTLGKASSSKVQITKSGSSNGPGSKSQSANAQLQKSMGIGDNEKTTKTSLLHKPKSPQPGRTANQFGGAEVSGIDEVDSNPHRPRKIPVHPYIAASKDGIWTDPLTSLQFPTDLCQYLGHTKKEAGRHTLMGVGQYYRTAFNIKVYGAALYVAKRDVLADPKFAKYATLSSEELTKRDDFYEHLMNMPNPGDDPSTSFQPGGFFDRTIFIKINMQLSTDAMRKSLEADWSLMTEEMKSLLIETSFRERMADERMLNKIKSKENSSNCSCGQSAPPEYAADPSCCARGTELVFTWRKNGDFEVRLDGRVMDTFPRPDMAKGIFAEYMNDNPISLDAKAHFTDGFPFLLAPLAQVKGMSSAVPKTQESVKVTRSQNNNAVIRLMDAALHSVGAVNSQAQSISRWMQDSAAEVSSNMEHALGDAIGVARGISAEFDRQRMELVGHAVALQEEGMKMLTSYISSSISGNNALSVAIIDQKVQGRRQHQFDDSLSRDSMFGLFGPGSGTRVPEVIPDEIGIKFAPTMNFTHKLFFTTVHFYLMLMLVVSLPGSYTTRFVVRRRFADTKKIVAVT